MVSTLLDVQNLHTRFALRKQSIYAVNDISFQLKEGDTLGVVGESGSGKSVAMLSLIRLLPPAARIDSGRVLLEGQDVLQMNPRQLQKVRGAQISMIFQDPMTSFNPVIKVGTQLTEGLIHHQHMSRNVATERAVELLNLVGIAEPRRRMESYPHELSGGMRQRVMIAMALGNQPRVVIADEPTTALDVTIQAQIVDLVKQIRDEIRSAIIWITHDLALISGLADRIIVMYGGTIVEEASADDLYDDPRHPYTIGLIGALPSLRKPRERYLTAINGTPPVLTEPPNFCPFVNRCQYAVARCRHERPPLMPPPGVANPTHRIACWVDIRTERQIEHG